MKKLFKYIGVFLRALPHFIVFELLFKLIMLAIGAPVLAFALKWTMKSANIGYLSDDNIIDYIGQPLTIAVLIIILFCSAIFSFIELSALAGCFACAFKKERITSLGMLRTGLSAFVRAFRGMGILDFIVFMFTIAIAQFTLSSGIFTAPLMPILQRIFHSVNSAATVVVFVLIQLLFIMLIISSCYSLHYLVLTKMDFHECIRQSRRKIVGKKVKMGLSMLKWTIIIALFITLLTFGVSFLIVFFVKGLSKPVAAFRTALKVLKFAGQVLLAVSVFFSTPAIMCWLTKKFYDDAEEDEELVLPDRKSGKSGRIKNIIVTGVIAAVGFGVNFSYIKGIYKGNIKLNTAIFKSVQVSAHRGCPKVAPENTLPAFERALTSGADYIELDVQLTKDGELVVFHDDTLDRTTDGKGNLTDYTYPELMRLSAGSWFGKENEFADVKIPKFTEVLDLVGNDVLLNVEIKNHGNITATAEKVVEILEEYDLKKSVYVTSFSYQALKTVKELDPKIKTGLIAHIAPSTVYTQMDYIDAISVNYLFINQSVVNYAHRSGKKVFVWTVDSITPMKKMISLGVDNIITNRPDKAVEIVDSNSISETVLTVLQRIFGKL